MKKLLSVLMVCVLLLSLCACSRGNDNEVETVEDKVKNEVRGSIVLELALYYETASAPDITFHVNEISETEYEVTGKITVKDKYGDAYTGKYDAVVTYDPTTDDYSADVDIGTLYKN